MIPVASTIITGATLLKLILGALAAGLGVTLAFSLLIYCAEHATAMRRDHRGPAALLYQAASVLALTVVVGIVAYGFILMTSKSK
jgi:nitric oxide reductase large subunit